MPLGMLCMFLFRMLHCHPLYRQSAGFLAWLHFGKTPPLCGIGGQSAFFIPSKHRGMWLRLKQSAGTLNLIKTKGQFREFLVCAWLPRVQWWSLSCHRNIKAAVMERMPMGATWLEDLTLVMASVALLSVILWTWFSRLPIHPLSYQYASRKLLPCLGLLELLSVPYSQEPNHVIA